MQPLDRHGQRQQPDAGGQFDPVRIDGEPPLAQHHIFQHHAAPQAALNVAKFQGLDQARRACQQERRTATGRGQPPEGKHQQQRQRAKSETEPDQNAFHSSLVPIVK